MSAVISSVCKRSVLISTNVHRQCKLDLGMPVPGGCKCMHNVMDQDPSLVCCAAVF
jgi:hypothetical protein